MRGTKVAVAVQLVGAVVLTAVRPAPAQPAAPPNDPRTLVQQALESLPRVPFHAHLKLSNDNANSRDLDLNQKPIDGGRASYLEVTAPPELEGIRFLFLEHTDTPSEQFMKIPSGPKMIRIAAEVRKQPFLGSTFYVADLVEPQIDAFTYRFAGEDDVSGRHCALVESVPKNPESEVYAKLVVYIDPKDRLILKRDFFAPDGKKLKVWTVDKIEKIEGHWTMRDQRMHDARDNSESRLQVIEVKYGVDLPNTMFTPKHMLR